MMGRLNLLLVMLWGEGKGEKLSGRKIEELWRKKYNSFLIPEDLVQSHFLSDPQVRSRTS